MWRNLNISDEDEFAFFLNFMNVYTCVDEHHDTYGVEKMTNLLHPVRVENERIEIFYYEDDSFKIMIGVMDHINDKTIAWAWASESRGVITIDNLIQHSHIYFQFIRNYLMEKNKTKWMSGITWKDFKPSYKIYFEDDVFWEKFESIGHEYLNFELEINKPLIFELKDDDR